MKAVVLGVGPRQLEKDIEYSNPLPNGCHRSRGAVATDNTFLWSELLRVFGKRNFRNETLEEYPGEINILAGLTR